MLGKYVADWEELCDWLEAQPYNASYDLPRGLGYLTSSPKETPIYKYGREKHDRAVRIHGDRQPIMYWASGYGWRLRKDYRDALVALRRRYNVGEDVTP